MQSHFRTLAALALLASLGACTTEPSGDAGTTDDATTGATDDAATDDAATDDAATDDAATDDAATDGNDETTGGVEGDFEPDCDAEFEITAPDPAYPWTPLSIELVSESVAPGVFVVYDARASALGPEDAPLATSGGFIIGDEGVLLVESMINQQLACQVVELVRAQTDLPIRYIVNTSHHGDHSYGNHYFGADTQIVQHAQTAAFIASESFEADKQWMIDTFGANQGMEEIQPRDADVLVDAQGWSVDLGGIVVEAHHFGFAQTSGDLFVWLPEAHVLWTGNAQVARAPGLPWLLEGQGALSLATMQAVKDFLPPDAVVVPGHDAPTSVAQSFDFTIDYLDVLLTEVQAAVDAGLTLEETVATVTMDEFRGYVLFDWVHPVLNVPTTYTELAMQ